MMLIRPVRTSDFNDIMALVSQSGFGLTNLPKDRDLIAKRIDESVTVFAAPDKKGPEATYLLVMEETTTGTVVGTGGIISQVGKGMPFYAYIIETHIKESPSLGIRKELECLHLLAMQDGPSEIGALFVHPQFQGKSHGRLMSLSRFLFLAQHPDLFAEDVIAEMRGVIDEEGKSPFWEALGSRFFEMDFPRADHLSARDKRFIAELMPRHPVYVTLLPPSAQAVIAQVHPNTRPALALLNQEGFSKTGMVDIFDAGPMVKCRRDNIRTIKESKTGYYAGDKTSESDAERPSWIVAAGGMSEFRACLSAVVMDDAEGVRLSSAAARTLGVKPGDRIRYARLRPAKGVSQ